MSIDEIAKQVNESKKPYPIVISELLELFGYQRRGKLVIQLVNDRLREKDLKTDPNLESAGYSDQIKLLPIDMPKEDDLMYCVRDNPIRRVGSLLEGQNEEVTVVKGDDTLAKAITLMSTYNYTQLPVTSNDKKSSSIVGYITWESIGEAKVHDKHNPLVKDYMRKGVSIISEDDPFLEILPVVLQKGFVLIESKEKEIIGIVTIADLIADYIAMTKKFLLLEQIENQVRALMNKKYKFKDVAPLLKEENTRSLELESLNFGDYERILENKENWDKLELPYDRGLIVHYLEDVRNIRNKVMHFAPTGIDEEEIEMLERITALLSRPLSYSK